MSTQHINLNTIYKILSNSVLIQDLELQRMERKNSTIRLFDHHDIFLVIFTVTPYIMLGVSLPLIIYTLIFDERIEILFNILHYSGLTFIVSFLLYNIISFVIDGNPFRLHNELKRLLEEVPKEHN